MKGLPHRNVPGLVEQRAVPKKPGICVYDPYQYAGGRISPLFFNTACGKVYVGKYDLPMCKHCGKPIGDPS
jgi:hypothetical protein